MIGNVSVLSGPVPADAPIEEAMMEIVDSEAHGSDRATLGTFEFGHKDQLTPGRKAAWAVYAALSITQQRYRRNYGYTPASPLTPAGRRVPGGQMLNPNPADLPPPPVLRARILFWTGADGSPQCRIDKVGEPTESVVELCMAAMHLVKVCSHG